MPGRPLHEVYAVSMRNHPYGHALYEPESSDIISPGTCGYLSHVGSWTPLVDLGDEAELRSLGLTPFAELQRAPQTSRAWGPKVSSGTHAVSIDLKAGVTALPAGIPLGAVGAVLKFSTQRGSGAILLTDGDVVKDSVYFREPYRLWCVENSSRILQRWPDVRQRGLWIVTETWSAPRVCTNAWQDIEKEVTVGFETSFTPVGELGPSSSWHTARNDSGWVMPQVKGASRRHVVFFGGLFFKYRKLAPMLPHKHAFSEHRSYKFRGEAGFIVEDPDDEASGFVVDVAEYGDEEIPCTHGDEEDDF